jgi:signal transduction histidine kinase
MLYQFLVANRDKVLALVKIKSADLAEDKPVSAESERGLPVFYDYLIRELQKEAMGHPKRSERKHGPSSTVMHGQELSRLGYTVSQVVHGYGVLCQAITELAEAKGTFITTGEFSTLNLSLDVAIADAVTGFTKQARIEDVDSAKRMGFLVHELRNALAAAIIAHSMVKKGVVGVGGSTNALLERNLNCMRDILDQSFSEVRMHSEKPVDHESVVLLRIVEEVEATASEQARSRGLTIKVDVDSGLQTVGDSNYLISALSNLVQNAIKYSKHGGTIWVRGRETERNVVLEVEDQCGGLPKGKAEELFKPFIQKNSDRTGLGLGLSISRQAAALNGGTLSVRDLPGKGCVFSIALPKPQSRAKRERGAAAAKRNS